MNYLPPKDSNWYRFANLFDIGILDLDEFASDLGYDDFNDLDISISPKALYNRDFATFLIVLKSRSLAAQEMQDSNIITRLVESF